MDGLLTVQQVADLLQVSRQTVWTLRRDGKLPTVRIGRSVRFRPEDVQRLISDGLPSVPSTGVPYF